MHGNPRPFLDIGRASTPDTPRAALDVPQWMTIPNPSESSSADSDDQLLPASTKRNEAIYVLNPKSERLEAEAFAHELEVEGARAKWTLPEPKPSSTRSSTDHGARSKVAKSSSGIAPQKKQVFDGVEILSCTSSQVQRFPSGQKNETSNAEPDDESLRVALNRVVGATRAPDTLFTSLSRTLRRRDDDSPTVTFPTSRERILKDSKRISARTNRTASANYIANIANNVDVSLNTDIAPMSVLACSDAGAERRTLESDLEWYNIVPSDQFGNVEARERIVQMNTRFLDHRPAATVTTGIGNGRPSVFSLPCKRRKIMYKQLLEEMIGVGNVSRGEGEKPKVSEMFLCFERKNFDCSLNYSIGAQILTPPVLPPPLSPPRAQPPLAQPVLPPCRPRPFRGGRVQAYRPSTETIRLTRR